METAPDWLSPTGLAEWIDIPVGTIYAWRHKGDGPPGYRVGKHVRYRREDVEAWLAEHADDRPAA